MALKAALMMGEGARGQEAREAQRRASSGMVRARLARERATRVRAVSARGGKLLSWEGRRNCPQGKRKAPTSGRYLKESLRTQTEKRIGQGTMSEEGYFELYLERSLARQTLMWPVVREYWRAEGLSWSKSGRLWMNLEWGNLCYC